MFILICRSISCNDHALIARLMAKQFLTRMFSVALTRSLRGRPRTRPWQLILRQLQTAKLWRRCLLCKTTHCDHVGSRVYYIYIWYIYIYIHCIWYIIWYTYICIYVVFLFGAVNLHRPIYASALTRPKPPSPSSCNRCFRSRERSGG